MAVVVGAAVAGIEQEGNPFPDPLCINWPYQKGRHRGMPKAAIQKVLFVI